MPGMKKKKKENVVGKGETRFRSCLIVCNRIHYTIQFYFFFHQLFKLHSSENNQVVLLPGYHKGMGGLRSSQKHHPKQQKGCSYCQVLRKEGGNEFSAGKLYIYI